MRSHRRPPRNLGDAAQGAHAVAGLLPLVARVGRAVTQFAAHVAAPHLHAIHKHALRALPAIGVGRHVLLVVVVVVAVRCGGGAAQAAAAHHILSGAQLCACARREAATVLVLTALRARQRTHHRHGLEGALLLAAFRRLLLGQPQLAKRAVGIVAEPLQRLLGARMALRTGPLQVVRGLAQIGLAHANAMLIEVRHLKPGRRMHRDTRAAPQRKLRRTGHGGCRRPRP